MPQNEFDTLSPDLRDDWCGKDKILTRVRQLRWIGRAEEAEELLRAVRLTKHAPEVEGGRLSGNSHSQLAVHAVK